MYDAFSVVGKKLEPERARTLLCAHLWWKGKAFYWGNDEACASLFFIEVLELRPSQKCLALFACTCGERPKHFIEDMNFQTRQRWGTCPPSKHNKTRFTCQLPVPTMGALAGIDHFQVFCKDYSHPWNTNPLWFPSGQEWKPRGT